MYNQYPQMCWLEGTRRWLPETDHNAVRQSFRELVADVGRRSGTTGVVDWRPVRAAFPSTWMTRSFPRFRVLTRSKPARHYPWVLSHSWTTEIAFPRLPTFQQSRTGRKRGCA